MTPRDPHPMNGDELLRALLDEPVPPMSAAEARELRARVVPRLSELRSRAVARRVRRGRWRRGLLLAAAAGVPLALLASTRLFVSSRRPLLAEVTAIAASEEIGPDGAEHPLPAALPTPLGPADELRTGPDGMARASLPTGARVDIGARARLRFARDGEARRGPVRDRVELLDGKIDVDVPRLRDGDELRVHTEDAWVVVHGTKFSVERSAPAKDGPAETRVTVKEGRVAVYFGREQRELGSGASFVVPATRAPAPEPADALQAAAPAPEPVSTSTLAAENGLLSDAMRRRREHDPAAAVRILDDLLARYPRSPLVETARVEKLRALQSLGRWGAARREAERYLTDYPNGSARQEALAVLAHGHKQGP